MPDYQSELERRIAQFAGYLDLMRRRAHEIVHGSCFIIFSADRSNGESETVLAEERELTLQATQLAPAISDPMCGQSESDFGYLPDEGWREDDSPRRFIQFAFEESWFCLDMPLQTLYRPEAEQILRDRSGFFFVSERPQFTLHGEDVEGFDPFRKIYIYNDEHSAAEDMAFVWFRVWKFPVDARLYVTAAACNGKHSWEESVPVG